MAEAVAGRWLADPRRLHGSTHGALHQARIQVMPSFAVLPGITPAAALGKQPLPGPFPCCMRYFLSKAWGSSTAPPARRQIGLAHTPHALHKCLFRGSTKLEGSTVRRSLSPLPQRTVMQRCSRSTSLIRSRSASNRFAEAAGYNLRPLP